MSIDLNLSFKILFILTLAAMSPGPDFFIVLRNSLTFGRVAGLLSALGVAIGCLVSFTIIILSLKILLAHQMLKVLMGIICGSYLIYLGVNSIRHKPQPHQFHEHEYQIKPLWIYFQNGFLTNILNPKLYTVCGAILTYAEQQHPNFATNLTILILNSFIVMAWFGTVSILLTHPNIRRHYFNRERLLNIFLGCLFILLGVRIILG